MHITGLDEPIGTTASHPFWSEDRSDWTAAGDLKVGETLRTLDGAVLAHQIEQAVETGRAKDYMDAARQLALTRARVTQIVNLLLLSSTIQDTILTEPDRVRHLSERRLRPVIEELDWQRQEILFRQLLTS